MLYRRCRFFCHRSSLYCKFLALLITGVTSVQEEGPAYGPSSYCPFHNNRNASFCCLAAEKTRNGTSIKGTRNRNTTRASGTQIHMGTKASQHDPRDILPGVDFSNTVI